LVGVGSLWPKIHDKWMRCHAYGLWNLELSHLCNFVINVFLEIVCGDMCL
jgi:hypothetical protein